jgi:hypothetical protein
VASRRFGVVGDDIEDTRVRRNGAESQGSGSLVNGKTAPDERGGVHAEVGGAAIPGDLPGLR